MLKQDFLTPATQLLISNEIQKDKLYAIELKKRIAAVRRQITRMKREVATKAVSMPYSQNVYNIQSEVFNFSVRS